MNELRLVNELVGGPYDGHAWTSDWLPHWSQRISWAAQAKPADPIRWAEYELRESRLAWHEGRPSVCFRYHFAGCRELRHSWRSALRRWATRLAQGVGGRPSEIAGPLPVQGAK